MSAPPVPVVPPKPETVVENPKPEKKKRKFEWTPGREKAFEKCRAARNKILEKKGTPEEPPKPVSPTKETVSKEKEEVPVDPPVTKKNERERAKRIIKRIMDPSYLAQPLKLEEPSESDPESAEEDSEPESSSESEEEKVVKKKHRSKKQLKKKSYEAEDKKYKKLKKQLKALQQQVKPPPPVPVQPVPPPPVYTPTEKYVFL